MHLNLYNYDLNINRDKYPNLFSYLVIKLKSLYFINFALFVPTKCLPNKIVNEDLFNKKLSRLSVSK